MKARVGTMLWVVAASAVLLSMGRCVHLVLYDFDNPGGPNTSLLKVGMWVVVYGDEGRPVRVAAADGEVSLVAGTEGVVTLETAVDRDDCYSDRMIFVRVVGGPHDGLEVRIPRPFLRVRKARGLGGGVEAGGGDG